jgi:hypothetical protein
MQSRALVRKAAKDDSVDDGRRGQRVDHRRHGDPRRTICGEAVNAGGDRGKRHRCKTIRLTKLKRAAIAGGQRLILTLASAMPDRSDRMNDMPRRQQVAFRYFGIAGGAAAEAAAFG